MIFKKGRMSRFDKNQKWSQETTTNNMVVVSIQYCMILYIKFSIMKYIAGLKFVKQCFFWVKYQYRMHYRWVCARGCGDYLQQVHLWIFHSSKCFIASDEQKQKNKTKINKLLNSAGADWLLQSVSVTVRKAKDGTMWEGRWLWSLWNSVFLSAYSAFSLPPSTGFTGFTSSSRACCRSLSFTSCTPQ